MYKLMIVDDDKIIRQSIIELIDWENSSFVLTGESHNGEDALCKIRENPPDFVISDIYMPIRNGIELFETVQVEFPNVMFVMLSNYDDFSYVRSALKIGAFDYLLKFELNRGMIHDLLNRVRKKLDTQYFRYEIEKRRLLIKNGEQIEIAGASGLDICGVLLVGYSREESRSLRDFLEALPARLESVFDSFLFTNSYQEHYLFLCYSPVINSKEAQMELMSQINWENPLQGKKYIIAESKFVRNMEQFALCYDNCHKMLSCSFYDGSIHFVSERNYKPFYSANSLEKYRKEIPPIIECLQKNSIELSTEKLKYLLQMLAFDNLLKRQVFMVLEYLVHEINEFCVAFDMNLPECFEEGLLPGNYFEQFENIQEIEEAYVELAANMELAHCSMEEKVLNEIAAQAVQYIAKNFNKPIGLQDVADEVNVNKNHLCRVLKKHTNRTFHVILNQMRIKYAKKLLQNTDMSLEQVAYDSGFSDYRYFKKVFMNSTGVFPTEYRKNKEL